MKTLLITGGSGLIGNILTPFLGEFNLLMPTHSQLNICDAIAVNSYVKTHKPDCILHLAAIRNAAFAETQRYDKHGSVWLTNVSGTYNVAQACKQISAHLIYTSSNYVFAGFPDHPNPYNESESPEQNDDRISWYGITKREGEKIVQQLNPNSAILRISNPAFSLVLNTEDYVGKVLWLTRRQLPLFINQQITITYGPSLVECVKKIVTGKLSGTYHVSTSDSNTPFNIGLKLLQLLGDQSLEVNSSDIFSYLEKNPLRYPIHGALSSNFTQKSLDLSFPKIEKVLYNLLTEHEKNS